MDNVGPTPGQAMPRSDLAGSSRSNPDLRGHAFGQQIYQHSSHSLRPNGAKLKIGNTVDGVQPTVEWLLPTYARNRILPPPVPSSQPATDPRAYASFYGVPVSPAVGPYGSAASESPAAAPSRAQVLYTGMRFRHPSGTSVRPRAPTSATVGLERAQIAGHVGQIPSAPTTPSQAGSTSRRPGPSPPSRTLDHTVSSARSNSSAPTYRNAPTRATNESKSRYPPGGATPRAPRGSWDFTRLRRDFDAQNRSSIPAHRVFPEDDPRIPPSAGTESGESAPQTKRTVFAPYELSILQALWAEGAYYPAAWQVEEVTRRTGLSRLQIRNWFANRRQRSVGDEKARVVRMGNELTFASST